MSYALICINNNVIRNINCMLLFSSSPLDSEVPLCHLHPYHDLFCLPPWVFSGVTFIHDHTRNTCKLVLSSVKGVFISYSRTQRGYQVYYPDQQNYVVSADVEVFESSHYFFSTSSSSFPHVAQSLSPIPTSSSSSSPADTSYLLGYDHLLNPNRSLNLVLMRVGNHR